MYYIRRILKTVDQTNVKIHMQERLTIDTDEDVNNDSSLHAHLQYLKNSIIRTKKSFFMWMSQSANGDKVFN
jgi:hypothetical protein